MPLEIDREALLTSCFEMVRPTAPYSDMAGVISMLRLPLMSVLDCVRPSATLRSSRRTECDRIMDAVTAARRVTEACHAALANSAPREKYPTLPNVRHRGCRYSMLPGRAQLILEVSGAE